MACFILFLFKVKLIEVFSQKILVLYSQNVYKAKVEKSLNENEYVFNLKKNKKKIW